MRTCPYTEVCAQRSFYTQVPLRTEALLKEQSPLPEHTFTNRFLEPFLNQQILVANATCEQNDL